MDFIGNNPTSIDYAIALGNFDGVHLGHQQVIKTARQKAQDIGCKSGVITFAPHPAKVIIGNSFQEILSLDVKLATIKTLGIDDIIVINFTEDFSKIPAESFINELCQKINIRSITTGYNFRFGHNRHGSISTINNLKKQYNFKFNVVNQVLYQDLQISSSMLRHVIKIGCMRLFSDFTGRYYTIECTLQSKTDNIFIYKILNRDLLLPPTAVYLGEIDGHYCSIFLNNIEIKVKFLNDLVQVSTNRSVIKFLSILGQESCLDMAIANDAIMSAYIEKAKFCLI